MSLPRQFAVIAFCCAIVGCGPRPKPTETRPAEAKGGDEKAEPSKLPTTLTYTYKGGNAEFWGKKLYEKDQWEEVTTEAGMFYVKEEGLRFSLKAMGDKDAGVRRLAMSTLSSAAKDYPDLFIPPLRLAITKGEPGEGYAAAQAAMRCKFKDLAADIRVLANAKDTSEKGKKQLLTYADLCEK